MQQNPTPRRNGASQSAEDKSRSRLNRPKNAQPKKESVFDKIAQKSASVLLSVCSFFSGVFSKIASAVSKAWQTVTAPFRPWMEKRKKKEPAEDGKTSSAQNNEQPSEADSKPKKEKKKWVFRPKRHESAVGNTIIGITKTFTYLACVTVAGAALAIFLILAGNDVFGLVKTDRMVTLTIPEQATVSDVGQILHDNGCISFPKIFELYCKFRKEKGDFLAGEYTISTAGDYDDYRFEFKKKEPEGTTRVMIPEGSTTDEIIDLFVSLGIGTKEGYVQVINEGEFDYWFVEELNKSGWSQSRYYRLDGYLFPDTYDFYLASSEWTVINKLLRRFNDIFNESMKTKVTSLRMSTDQVVTLASMVEKEAYYASDMTLISSVFHNRLSNSFLFPFLQSDATIAYAMQHDNGVRPSDSEINKNYISPYNTYLFAGLPPGPIANPGYAALAAALYPSKTTYYYFVSYPSGYTLYGATLQEHEANIQQIEEAKQAKKS